MSDVLNQIDKMFDEAIKNTDEETLGEKLQKKRESLGLKMVDIAKISGLSESLIGKIESNKIDDIKISTMKRLCGAYEVSPKLFIDRMGIKDSTDRMNKKMKEISKARKTLKEEF